MANFHGATITEHSFSVKDPEAFIKVLEAVGIPNAEDAPDMERLCYEIMPDGSFWIGGYTGSTIVWNEDTDEEVDILDIIQGHILPDEYADIRITGAEKLRYVVGIIYIVTSKEIYQKSLDDVFSDWKTAHVYKKHAHSD